MILSNELISQFVKVTNDNEKPASETTVYGTAVVYDGAKYVKLDGSDLLTPVSTTTDINDGERVTVLIKNHTATVTGNISSPSARTDDVQEIGDQVSQIGSKIAEFEIVIADKVSVKQLEAESGRIDNLVSDNVTIRKELEANKADIGELEADNVTINEKLTANEAAIADLDARKIDADVVDAKYATVENLQAVNANVNNLEATYGDFSVLTTEKFAAIDANFLDIETRKLSAEDADLKYANIDFSNIGQAAIEEFFSKSGLIEDLVVGDGTVTGNLVGVTIKGDLIEGNTVKADKLVVLGSDGLYYKLNFEGGTFTEGEEVPTDSLHGSIITAKSITAEKVSVKDLVAFDATIGGFIITDKAIHSVTKDGPLNSTIGIYMDSDGQMSFGDATNYLRYYKLEDGTYTLEMSAASFILSSSGKDIETFVDDEILEAEDRIHTTISEKETSIISTSESLILSALESYVETGDYDEFKQTVETTLTIMSDEIDMNFTNTMGQIENIDGELQSKFADLNKHITFSEDGIVISAGENAMTIRIDNDLVIFEKNGVQFGWWDGIDFHTGNIMVEVTERAQFGNFAFVPRTDGSLSFLKVEHRAGFYAILRGSLLVIYGAYPTLSDTTFVIEDIPAEFDGTTLILTEG